MSRKRKPPTNSGEATTDDRRNGTVHRDVLSATEAITSFSSGMDHAAEDFHHHRRNREGNGEDDGCHFPHRLVYPRHVAWWVGSLSHA